MKNKIRILNIVLLGLFSITIAGCGFSFDSQVGNSDSLNSSEENKNDSIDSQSDNSSDTSSSESTSEESSSEGHSSENNSEQKIEIALISPKNQIHLGERLTFKVQSNNPDIINQIGLQKYDPNNTITIDGFSIKGVSEGTAVVNAYYKDIISNIVSIDVLPFDKSGFYENYLPATSYDEAMFRTSQCLMSGDIVVPDQACIHAINQPKQGGKYVHNSNALFSNNNNTYTVLNSDGTKAFDIYKNAAYTSIEEVAAYVYAFGDIPSNYTEKKSGDPQTSPWGEYLRLNFSFFDHKRHKKYQPELPFNLGGPNSRLKYFEIDVGTTGTDCDPKYPDLIYNDGSTITRGAARLVFSYSYADDTKITDLNDRYVFYTYNHYNDFSEYLNYYHGWGEMFGNITGGGTISSTEHYNPTPYVDVVRSPII